MISNIEVTKRAHISRRKYDTIYKCFVEDVSRIVNVNINTANRYYKLFRSIILGDIPVNGSLLHLEIGSNGYIITAYPK